MRGAKAPAAKRLERLKRKAAWWRSAERRSGARRAVGGRVGAWGAHVRWGRGKWKLNRKGDAPALPSGCASNASACLRKSGNLKRMFRVEHLARSAQEGSGARAMADGGFYKAGK